MAVATLPTHPTEQTVLAGLARALVQHRLLRPDQAVAIQKKADAARTPFIDELTQGGHLPALQLARFVAETFGHPLFDLAAVDVERLPGDLIDRKLAIETRVIALGKRGSRLSVAISDPTDLQALDRIKFQTESTLDPVVVEHDKLLKLVERLGRSAAQRLAELVDESLELDLASDEGAATLDTNSEVDDAPVVKFLQKVLLDAIQAGASDLHFEPYEKFYRIRMRVDGELREFAQPPLAIKEKLASRIKVISRMDISERRVPQDGRMKLAIGPGRSIDFRVSTLPTLFGEKIVMRILDPQATKLGIDALGYEPDQREAMLEAIRRPYGMILVTGPTGSGKTVSLYSCLNILNQPGINISTAEDPAEINLPGINQVNVNDKAGLSFAAALRSFLRQDPDVIMVGEIRDLETADIAIKAAQTGHMVMSTLHTNDAPTTLTRMMNMGVAPFNIASSVILITAQRLARRLCACKQPLDLDEDALLQAGFLESDLDGSWQPYRPVGCEHCSGSGYKGRLGIYQVMPITEEIQRIILGNGNALQIADQARREGVRDLRRSGLIKVMHGVTSIEEVLGVTNE
ncbi:type IV-A pilus assembly ATPase PilB [Quisquiliibacterium transsilvanicum]|jgi:type IV pilus assembly protein PilB|uniref:type IV-A pilus assembly ATPase PilB n=1 Tax=Quisquiliibacterium transsilvanicum TaxID=1549638 RepID=UPI00160EF435|nr:type IV-A pilus assembly ATPase PilB [Quisquiliibacterium transsilvanicum]